MNRRLFIASLIASIPGIGWFRRSTPKGNELKVLLFKNGTLEVEKDSTLDLVLDKHPRNSDNPDRILIEKMQAAMYRQYPLTPEQCYKLPPDLVDWKDVTITL